MPTATQRAMLWIQENEICQFLVKKGVSSDMRSIADAFTESLGKNPSVVPSLLYNGKGGLIGEIERPLLEIQDFFVGFADIIEALCDEQDIESRNSAKKACESLFSDLERYRTSNGNAKKTLQILYERATARPKAIDFWPDGLALAREGGSVSRPSDLVNDISPWREDAEQKRGGASSILSPSAWSRGAQSR